MSAGTHADSVTCVYSQGEDLGPLVVKEGSGAEVEAEGPRGAAAVEEEEQGGEEDLEEERK